MAPSSVCAGLSAERLGGWRACAGKSSQCKMLVEALKQHIWDEYCAVSIFYTVTFRSCISKVVKDMNLPVQNIMPIVDEISKLFT